MCIVCDKIAQLQRKREDTISGDGDWWKADLDMNDDDMVMELLT